MKLLFESWRKYLLTEAAKGPEDLPDGIFVRIKSAGAGKKIFLAKQTGNASGDPRGEVSMMYTGGPGEGACLYAYMVNYSQADEGWGPMLYDVAMEVAGDSGLIADRDSLSDDAYAVWQYYMKNRSDVKKKQLDDMADTLTQDQEDNCETDTAQDHETKEPGTEHSFDGDEDMVKQALYLSPVMKVYTKETSTIDKLKKMKPPRLIRE